MIRVERVVIVMSVTPYKTLVVRIELSGGSQHFVSAIGEDVNAHPFPKRELYRTIHQIHREYLVRHPDKVPPVPILDRIGVAVLRLLAHDFTSSPFYG